MMIFGISWISICILLIIIFGLIFATKGKSTGGKLPPGPKGWPVLGNLLDFIDSPMHIKLDEYAKKCGPVYTIYALGRPSVILNDVNSIREGMVTLAPTMDTKTDWRYCFKQLLKGISVLPYSLTWRNTRRRTVTILRDFGMGKLSMESKICNETSIMILNIIKLCDSGKTNIDVRSIIRRAPANIICDVLFNKRYDYGNKNDIKFVLDCMEKLLSYLRAMCIHDLLPNSLRPVVKYQLKDFEVELKNLENFFQNIVDKHKLTYEEGIIRDFVDAWLKESNRTKNESLLDCYEAHNDNIAQTKLTFSPLKNILQDLMFAGSHSSAYAMTWIVLLLVLNKDIQDKVYKEIISVTKGERFVTMTDRNCLVLVEAVILESLRIATLVPLVGHACTKDIVFRGYNLPKGTEVTYNNWSVNFNEEIFPDAKSFKPFRWIKDREINKQLTTYFFPFGIGKRQCPGESLGRMELFLITTTLFQNLEFLMPDSTVEEDFFPCIEHVQKFVLEPKEYKVRILKRPEFNSNILQKNID